MRFLILLVLLMTWSLVGLVYLNTLPPEIESEKRATLYCQYGAGYGKMVFGFEKITDAQILTDENEVFDLRICEEWKQDENKTK